MISKANVQNIYPLTPLQEGMLFHSLRDTGPAYFEQVRYRVEGRLDIPLFRDAWEELVRRHDVLRTIFVHLDVPRPLQIVLKRWRIDFSAVDLAGVPRDEAEARIVALQEQDRATPFNLARDPLMRVAVVVRGDDDAEVLWSYHHIILDGWSAGILQGELAEIYGALLRGGRHALPEPAPFAGYVTWLGKQDQEESRRFWREYLAGFSRATGIPVTTGAAAGGERGSLAFRLDEQRSGALAALASENGVTLNVLLQTLWGILLCRCNGVADALFAATVSGRPDGLAGIEGMVGLFINAVPVRVRLAGSTTLPGLLSAMQGDALAASRHHWCSLAEIQAETPLKQALLDHVLIFENYPLDERIAALDRSQGPGFAISGVRMRESTSYPFELCVVPGSEIEFTMGYDTAVYSRDRIRQVAGWLERLVDGALALGTAPLAGLSLLSPRETVALGAAAAGVIRPWPVEKSMADLFREQAAGSPGAVAVVAADRTLTYGELDRLSDRCAARLQECHNLGAEEVVGVMTGRSSSLAVAVLGILKGGGVYLPIDPDQPEPRIRHIISDSGLGIILCDGENAAQAALHADMARVIDIAELMEQYPAAPVRNRPTASSAAYAIYTSGSTGLPKGVLLEHGGFVNMILHQIDTFGIEPADRCLLFSSCSFDGAMSEIFLALHSGATLVIARRERTKDPEEFSRLLTETGTTVATLPPAYLNALRSAGSSLDPLRIIISAGEAAIAGDLLHYAGTRRLFNAYGPTEASVCAAIHRVDPAQSSAVIPLGDPIANSELLLLDEGLQPVPAGAVGEICLAGPGLARCYLNSPELTARAFVPHLFRPGQRLYRTGDLARRRTDGELEFLGRRDGQVKVRGFRIECGEVERALSAHPAVNAAVVVARGEGGARELVAFLLMNGEPDLESLRSALAGQLPSYMMPARFVPLEAFPLTGNGKVDRSALACRDIVAAPVHVAGDPPATPMEKRLAALWEQVLGCGAIARHDSFFEIGGHSIAAIRAMAAIRRQIGIPLPLSALFQHPTLRGLALECERRAAGEAGEECHLLLSRGTAARMFAFPPITGYPVAYSRCAELLDDVSFHGFSFIESDDRLQRYVERIDQLQPDGPLILFGYSSGGNLAFEVAKELERHGRTVSDLILLDSWKRPGCAPVAAGTSDRGDEEPLDPALYGNLAPHLDDPRFRECALAKLRSYRAFTDALTTQGVIAGAIHLLRAGEATELDGLSQDWYLNTISGWTVHDGAGPHLGMLQEPWVTENARVISALLPKSA